MVQFLRRRTKTELFVTAGIAVALIVALILATTRGAGPHRGAAAPRAASSASSPPVGSIPPSPSVPSAGPSRGFGTAPTLEPLPATESADVYAAEVARALWTINYAATTRDQVLAFWQRELATIVPSGAPAGTTVAQAQAAAMSTLQTYLPGDAQWSTLARDHTTSTFTVTAVSEPPSWVAAVTDGQITDPGLTARTVLGVQTISYRSGTVTQTSRQSQQLTLALLCPPTSTACQVEIIPPTSSTGSSGVGR